jgi:hypothetical protein
MVAQMMVNRIHCAEITKMKSQKSVTVLILLLHHINIPPATITVVAKTIHTGTLLNQDVDRVPQVLLQMQE